MLVRWLTPAHKDLISLVEWYQQNAPEALQAVAQKIWDAAQSLAYFPNRGRNGVVTGTKELLVQQSPYMLVYKIHDNDIVILRLLHQHQNWPEE